MFRQFAASLLLDQGQARREGKHATASGGGGSRRAATPGCLCSCWPASVPAMSTFNQHERGLNVLSRSERGFSSRGARLALRLHPGACQGWVAAIKGPAGGMQSPPACCACPQQPRWRRYPSCKLVNGARQNAPKLLR